MYEIYTQPGCEDSVNAEIFLIQRNLKFVVKPFDSHIEGMLQQALNTENITTPQVFLGDEYIGTLVGLVCHLAFRRK